MSVEADVSTCIENLNIDQCRHECRIDIDQYSTMQALQ